MARCRTRLLGLTASAHGRFRWFSGRLCHFRGQPDAKVVGDCTDVGDLPFIQRPQEAGNPVAGIGDHRGEGDTPGPGLIQQLQRQLGLGGKVDRVGYMGLPAASAILRPTLRQIQPSRDGPVQGLRSRGIVHDILGADHDLAVALLAQRPRVLLLHADRGVALFGQAGVIQHQHAVRRTPLDQQPHPLFVQRQRIPGGIGQQMLQLLQRGRGHRLGDRLTVLARQIGQQAGDVAFHRSAAGRHAETAGQMAPEMPPVLARDRESLWAR